MSEWYIFTEHNDNEGESWNFYIPVEGNEEAVDLLADYLGEQDADEMYTLDPDPIEIGEDMISRLPGDATYMPEHNVLHGLLDVDKINALFQTSLEDDDPFYKGGIKDFMV